MLKTSGSYWKDVLHLQVFFGMFARTPQKPSVMDEDLKLLCVNSSSKPGFDKIRWNLVAAMVISGLFYSQLSELFVDIQITISVMYIYS